MYKVSLDIRHSSTLAYTVNKCTSALWLRFTGLPWGRGSGQLNLGRLSLMPPSGSIGKLQAPRGTSWAQPCGCPELRALVLNSVTLCGSTEFCPTTQGKSRPWERIVQLRQDVPKHPGSSSWGRTEDQCQGGLRGGMGIPEKLGPKGLCLGGSEKGWGHEGQEEKAH